MVKITNLKYCLEDRVLYDNLSYTFEKKRYIIKGRNGVGKTTLLNIVTGMEKGYSGKIKKDKIVYISQENYLFLSISVKENIQILSENYEEAISLIDKMSDIDINKKVKTLSGGQKQLVKLAIGLFNKADNYLIDEPFNDLDKKTANEVKCLIEGLKGCVIIIDHQDKIEGKKVYLKKRRLLND